MVILTNLATLSNALTLLRGPLALLFLYDVPIVRVIAIFLAMLTDFLDGYFARKHRTVSRLGAVLDPVMDRFFVVFALAVLVIERHVVFYQVVAMLIRDIVLTLFMLGVTFSGRLNNYEVRATFWGKITTFLQFCLLLVISLGGTLPPYVFLSFFPLSLMLFKELVSFRKVKKA